MDTLYGDTVYLCDKCGLLCLNFVLDEHMTKVHTNTEKKSFECEIFNGVLKHKSDFNQHYSKYMGKYPKKKSYTCNICSKTFARNYQLIVHNRTHTGIKPFKCNVCGSMFTQKSSLQTHFRTHTGEKPYKCDVCGDSFKQLANLTVHYRTHTGKKPFSCNICGKTVIDSSSLLAHYRSHTGEKPYKCVVCGISYGKSYSCNRHILRKHK